MRRESISISPKSPMPLPRRERPLRVAIFEPYPDIATNPTLVCLVRALRNEGARVDVFMPVNKSFPRINDCSRVFTFPFRRELLPWTRSFRDWGELYRRHQIDNAFRDGYDLILGVDPIGLTVAADYGQRFSIPFVYISFELYFRDELGDNEWLRELKEREIETSRRAEFIIIQDRVRANLLATENGLSEARFQYLPVAPGIHPETQRTDFLRNRLGISRDRNVVLHSGAFSYYTCAAEIMDQVGAWPEESCLVVHTRNTPNRSDPFVERARSISDRRFVLSLNPLEADQYEEMVASADLGLALYQCVSGKPDSFALGKNLLHIGLASGKFAQYMKHGVPAITTQQPMFEELLRDYSFGACVESIQQVPDAVRDVIDRLESCRSEARRLFRERLAFDVHWGRIRTAMMSLCR